MQGINIRNLILKQLLFQLNEQYENNTFEINQSLRHAIEAVLDHKTELHIETTKKQEDNIRAEINLFLFALVKAPSIWADMLKNDKISSTTTTITINAPDTLTRVYKEVVKQATQLINEHYSLKNPQGEQEKNKLQFNFEKEYMNEATQSMMAYLLNNLAQQICKFYSFGKQLIQKEEKRVEEEIKTSQIMNAYFLFGMLKQLNYYSSQKMEEEMTIYFKNLPAKTIQSFCRYVQKNYELVDLVCSQGNAKIFSDEEMQQNINEQNQYWLNFLLQYGDDQLILKGVQSTKGDTGVMIVKSKIKEAISDQNYQSFNDAEKLIMKIGEDNRIYVTNSQASQKKWQIFNMKDSVSNFYKILKQQLETQTSGKIDREIVAYGVPLGQYANIGGNLGRCIADINKYKSANHFLKDLSTSTIIGGSMTYILTKVPILSYFVIAGGLTYTFYHTLHNKATSKLKKAKQVGKVTLTSVSAVGTTVAGMMIGQTLIPIPFLGAFVGGVIGGFLGQTGTNVMTKLMNKESFRNLINFLKDDMIDQKRWVYSRELLEKLGISQKYFNTELCQKENKKDAYITAICFCVVASYEAKRYTAHNEQKMKQLEAKKQEKTVQSSKQGDEIFENEFNIVGIIDYLTEQHIVLLNKHKKLQDCIRHLAI